MELFERLYQTCNAMISSQLSAVQHATITTAADFSLLTTLVMSHVRLLVDRDGGSLSAMVSCFSLIHAIFCVQCK